MLDESGGVRHRLPRVVDELGLDPLPGDAQSGRVANQRTVHVGHVLGRGPVRHREPLAAIGGLP